MKCPNCDAPEKVRIRHCTSCDLSYSTEDLLYLRQLEYLLDQTADWVGATSYRTPYLLKLNEIKKRILPTPAAETEKVTTQKLADVPESTSEPVPAEALDAPLLPIKAAVSTASVTNAAKPVPTPISTPVPIKPQPKPAAVKEKVPFDQWLLSERNIKIALYSGAVLLVLAGIIFIGINWTRFSGGVKFLTTSLVTAITYVSGYLFFKRPALRLGGNALLSIAEGFFALNFGVLQIYVLGPMGLPDDVMWLITSPLCFALYLYTAYWTKSDLFTYFSIAAVGSTLAAALVVASAPIFVFLPAFSLLLILFWGLSIWLKNSAIAKLTTSPLRWISQILMPPIVCVSIAGWFFETGCAKCSSGSPFLPLVSMGLGVVFYIFTELTTKRMLSRWASSILFTLTLGFTMAEFNLGKTEMGIGLMLQALAYLWLGYWLNQKASGKSQDLSLYVVAYVVAAYLTYSTIQSSSRVITLVLVLFGDVLLVGTTSFIRRSHRWLYGAAWLALIPVYLLADLYVPKLHLQGLVMFGFGFINFIAGYIIGRKSLKWSGPFLTSSAILSVVSVGLASGNLLITSIILITWFLIYLFAAVWLKWTWLLVPALAAVNLAAASLNMEFAPKPFDMLIISYTGLGILCWIIGRRMSKVEEEDWTWPLYALGILDFAGAYLASLWFGEWLAIGVSFTLATLFLVYASLKATYFIEKITFLLLPYLGIVILFISQFYLFRELNLVEFWPAITVGVCGVFAAIAWLLRGRKFETVYELPFRLAGLALMSIPLAGLILDYTGGVAAFVFIVCGAIYLVDAGLRRLTWMAYLGVVVIFAAHFFIRETLWPASDQFWPAITVGVCGVFAAIGWLLRGRKFEAVYELPFRLAGLGLMAIALAGSILDYTDWVAAFAFIVCGAIYLVDAGLRRLTWMAYPGVVVIFAAHFFIRETFWPAGVDFWFPIAAGVCVLFIIISWFTRGRKSQHTFYLPFRLGGLILMAIPLGGILEAALNSENFLIAALTLGIAGTIYIGDAAVIDTPLLGYLGIFNFAFAIWAILTNYEVNELQAYVFPLGLALLGIGWYERVRYQGRLYRLFTMAGCIILLGTAFYQSMPRAAWEYALLVGIESIIAIFWGIRTKSRGYVQVGGIALIANALVQFVPSFLEWSRWMQIGLTGSILLGLGLVALFRREKLLETRKKLTTEWQSWNP